VTEQLQFYVRGFFAVPQFCQRPLFLRDYFKAFAGSDFGHHRRYRVCNLFDLNQLLMPYCCAEISTSRSEAIFSLLKIGSFNIDSVRE
jgi:hypothetical protein